LNIKTYILHCKDLPERKKFIEDQLDKNNFTDVTWYTDDDARDQRGKDLTGTYDGIRPEIFVEKVKVGGWNYLHNPPRALNPAEISLTTKFGKVFQTIGEGSDQYSIIFEDDAILKDNFSDLFHTYLSNTPDDWDVIYMGNGANLHPKNIEKSKLAYKIDHPASRCADSILIKRDAAFLIGENYFPFDLCSDWEIGYLQSKLDLNVYWWEPTIVSQGSETGKFKSSLR